MSNRIPEYVVVPFRPQLKASSKYGEIAVQVHSLISKYVSEGWEYVSIEKIEATINHKIAADEKAEIQVMIFKK